MNIKAFEIRDRATFIPVVAIQMVPAKRTHYEDEKYLLRRSGFNFDDPLVVLCRMEAEGTHRNATYDPFAWGDNGARTLTVAHQYIQKNFGSLDSGEVIDVEYILGETKEKKSSERFYQPKRSPAGEDNDTGANKVEPQ